MASNIKFYRGIKNNYDSQNHENGIYFAIDTKEVLMNGNSYGGQISDVKINDEGNLVIEKFEGDNTIITISQGLEATNNAIKVALSESSTEAPNYLVLEDDGLAVRSIDTKSTIVDKTIVVKGGPLASTLNAVGITEIPKDMTMQELLQKLFLKELYPYNNTSDSWYDASEAELGNQTQITYSPASGSNSITAPTVSIKSGTTALTSGSLIEVGSVVTVQASSTATQTKAASSKVSGLTYGYATTINGDITTSTTITQNVVYTVVNGAKNKLETSITRFNNGTIETVETSEDTASYQNKSLEVSEGSNEVSVKITGKNYSWNCPAINSVYIVSNIGNTTSDKKTAQITTKSGTLTAPTATKEFLLTGVYPIFVNGVSASNTNRDPNLPSTMQDAKLSLVNYTSAINVGCKFASEAQLENRLYFDYPATVKVNKVEFFNTVSGAWEPFTTSGGSQSIANKTIQGKSVSYKRWTTTGNFSGAIQLRFNIQKV